MRLGMVSTYPPRRCGLAGYAHDLGRAISRECELVVCAVDGHGLNYPDEVVAVIAQDEAEDYRRAARILAEHAVDAVLIQHADGLFGGPGGAHVLGLAHELRMRDIPYVVTLHAVPAEPGGTRTLTALTEGAAAVTVFTEAARVLAVSRRVAGPSPIAVVPYGALPRLPDVRGQMADGAGLGTSPGRPLAGALEAVRGCRVLSTFGLIGPGKGLEIAISAMPKVLADHPDVRYIIAGATHPDEAREHGEAYRESLWHLVDELDLIGRVHMVDAYLGQAELAALLRNTDVYLAPRLHPDHSYSGTLTLAVAAGCPVVAAEHPYAREMLAAGVAVRAGAGVVVPGGDLPALAEAVVSLLADPQRLAAAAVAGGALGHARSWPVVARRTVAVVRDAVDRWVSASGAADPLPLPDLRVDHIGRLADEIGIVRSARGLSPDTGSGYGVDDVARLAIVAARLLSRPPESVTPSIRRHAIAWATTALRLLRAGTGPAGLRGQLAYSGIWVDEPHLGDHVNHALWALGAIAGGPAVPRRLREEARTLRDELAGFVVRTPGLLANAYAVLGLCPDPSPSPRARAALAMAAARLDEAWGRGSARWRWFDDRLGTEPARLPQALIAAGRRLGDAGMVGRGLACLDWYARRVGLATADGVLRLGGDERPGDIGALVEALVEAFGATRARQYARLARRAFAWFGGANRLDAPVYDPDSGGCRDVLSATWVSPNQGAEATLAYHQALLALVDADVALLPRECKGTPQSVFV